MALRRDVDKYLRYNFEELVDLIVEQEEKVEILHERILMLEEHIKLSKYVED